MKISSYTVTLLSVFLVLAACGGGGGGSDTNGTPPVIDPDTESKALLVPVVNDTQLLASLRMGLAISLTALALMRHWLFKNLILQLHLIQIAQVQDLPQPTHRKPLLMSMMLLNMMATYIYSS